jgi:ADP-ribose pyrophosphatase
MQINHSKQIFSGKVVKLAVHEIRLPDGNLAVRELIEHPGAVAVVALDSQQNVMLVRQFRIGANRELYEIPAGLLEAGETPEACARRELREEIGYEPGRLESLGGFFPAAGYTTEYIHLYFTRDLIYSPLAQDRDEFIEVVRLPLPEAVRLIEQGEIVDSKTIIGLLKVVHQLGLRI